MNEIIKRLPIKTLEEVLSADESTFPAEVREILQWKGVEEYFRCLSEEDALTRAIYGSADEKGLVRFPAATNDVTLELFDKIGAQSSIYHQETVEEHIQLVFHNASTYSWLLRFPSPVNRYVLFLALLHDCGKKYTAGTNKRGELCFYGHDKLSALIANSYLKQMGVSDKDREWIVTGIFYHMRPKAWERMEENGRQKSQKKFIRKYGETMFWTLKEFALWDFGVACIDAKTQELFRIGKAEAVRLFKEA